MVLDSGSFTANPAVKSTGNFAPRRTRTRGTRHAMAAGALAAGIALVGAVAPSAQAAESSLPTGSTISKPLNDLAAMSAPSTDFLASITQFLHKLFPPFLPGPFVGSTGMGSGEGSLDWNLRR
ncbi:hypothetical protein [Corynebacterium resistens]|uniref:hypothetical protein n=1 Tax=Corynebacterium resistens TaxID=258224 RepID=UPI002354F3E6|nr:hypothetical protein [Corynebacterium resistens]